ncbi:hypothetical protein GI582_16665 [Sulfitobacter sp. BDSS02]|nr:hypothetical protein [Sulfitobacter sp. BDSS02]
MPIPKRDNGLKGVAAKNVDALARRVISELRNKPPKEFRERVTDATDWLVRTAMSKDIFILEEARNALLSRDLSPADIIDYCISDAAREMGRQWEEDEASFAAVSLGSARLHGLCKLLSADWHHSSNLTPMASVLIAVCDREDHLIGPVVLADKIRRSGYSVHLIAPALPEKIVSKLTSEPFETVLISCSGSVALDNVVKTVQVMRSRLAKTPRIVLGGPIIQCEEDLIEKTGVDLVTSDYNIALAAIDCDINERVMDRK